MKKKLKKKLKKLDRVRMVLERMRADLVANQEDVEAIKRMRLVFRTTRGTLASVALGEIKPGMELHAATTFGLGTLSKEAFEELYFYIESRGGNCDR